MVVFLDYRGNQLNHMKTFLLIFLTTLASYGYCCTCGPTRSITEEFIKSDKVVIGIIINQDPVLQIDSAEFKILVNRGMTETQARRFTSGGYYEYTMVLTEPAYKGAFATDTILIRTGLTSGTCSYSFQFGKKYIVYGYKRDPIPNESQDGHEQYWTNICTRTNLYSEKEKRKLMKIAGRTKKKIH